MVGLDDMDKLFYLLIEAKYLSIDRIYDLPQI